MNSATPAFHDTRWTLVLRARGESEEAKAALSDLCAAYYAPVVAFLRREGRDDDAARDLAHGFFAALLASGVGAPEETRGRFRSYLLGALKHFLAKARAAAAAGKRGGGMEQVPLVTETDTSPGLPLPAAPEQEPELIFDREWAFTLIARALAALEAESAHREGHFAALKPWLDGGASGGQAEAAAALGMSETAVKVAIHRLRVRFRELIRAEVAATLHDPADLAGELRHLFQVAGHQG
jgi:DNA-directed RNA polymerase specialized sigma24 family protein